MEELDHDRICERWWTDFAGSPEEIAVFREWVAEQHPDGDLEETIETDELGLWVRFRETQAWTDSFLDFAYASEEKERNR